MNDTFYSVRQKNNSGTWKIIGYFKTVENAEKYVDKFNTLTDVYPVKIVECEFLDNDID